MNYTFNIPLLIILFLLGCKEKDPLEPNLEDSFIGSWSEIEPCGTFNYPCDTLTFSQSYSFDRVNDNVQYSFEVLSEDSLIITSSIQRKYQYLFSNDKSTLTILGFVSPPVGGPPGVKYDIELIKN